ncbi:transposase domain-containing protein [Erwinia piriflorinigrans]
MSLEFTVWLVVGISIFCNRSMTEIVSLMDITDRTGEPFTAHRP